MWRLLFITMLAAFVRSCGPLPRGGAYSAWSGSPQETISGVPIQWREVEPGRFQMILGRAELYQQQDAVAVLSTRLCPQGYTIDFFGERGMAEWMEVLVSCKPQP